MLLSIISLLLLILPGYSLLHITWIQKKIDFSKIDKIVFGFVIWLFYIVSTILISNIIFPVYFKHVFAFNYLLGSILVGYWLFKKGPKIKFNLLKYNKKINLMDITLGGTLPFLLFMVAFMVIITLYTPIIYQYDALARYLTEGRQLIEGSSSLTGTWPTFGDSMPIMPIIYSWFFLLSDAPILRLIPLTLFFLTILLVFNIGRKLSPKNSHAAYISVISFVSTFSLQWYMAKTSLYLDLIFMFFTASSIYALMIASDDESTIANFLILGMNMSLLLISKEYGIFLSYFIFGVLVFSRYNKTLKNSYSSLFYSLFLIIPFSVRLFSYLVVYSFTDKIGLMPVFVFQFFIIFLSLFTQILLYIRGELKYIKLNLSTLTMVMIPLIIPALFFINNFLVFGTPLGTMKDNSIESLYEMGIVYTVSTIRNVSLLNIPNLFLSNGLLAINFLPLLFFLLNSLMPRMYIIQDKHSKLLTSWFFFSLLLFFFVSGGYIKGGLIRRILILAVPVALMVGKGVHYLMDRYSLPYYIGNLTYLSSISIFLAYIWFIKLDVTEWWLTNLSFLIDNFTYVHPMEVVLYSVPWLLLFIFIKLRKNNLVLATIYSKKFSAKFSIIIILISALTPGMMFIQAIKYPTTWNPSYYDEADSVKSYSNHWHISIIEYYRSKLNNDDSTTIGFGVTPIQYFLERPFIDLNHPRNWLMYLPLFTEISSDELLSYLEGLDTRYFLIPSKKSTGWNRYESALKNSTLFNLIETSEVFTGSDGQMFRFKRLAEYRPFVLYGLTRLPNYIPINIETGTFTTNKDYDSYRLYYDAHLKEIAAEWTVNTSVLGWRSLRYSLPIPLNLSNGGRIILSIKTNSIRRNVLFKLGSERPWENKIGWNYYVPSEGWNIIEFNMTQPEPVLNESNFNPTNVWLITLGLSVKPNTTKNIQVFYSIKLPSNSP